MLYAMIYKAQEEPAAVKYISFSFPSCPALLKPPLYANVTEDANGRHQGHELAGRMGRKMGLREEKERTRESSQGTRANETAEEKMEGCNPRHTPDSQPTT